MTRILTHEIGSLAKPGWRVKVLAGKVIEESDIEYAKKWAEILDIGEQADELLRILDKRADFTADDKRKVVDFSVLFALKFFEKAGLDIIYDGEQRRVEMYEYAVRRIKGFKFVGHVRSFDNKYFRKAACVKKPKLESPYHVDEFLSASKLTKKPLKVPITGAYTIADWSYDEHYIGSVAIGSKNFLEKLSQARKAFISDLAKEVIHPNIKALIDAGAKYIQIDEPAATTKRNEIKVFIDSVIDSIGDLTGKAFFTIHICFSDYSLLFPEIGRLEGIIDELHFEYANDDTTELGVSAKKRKGYRLLDTLREYDFKIGLGTIDVHTDFIEPPELVRDRILYAIDRINDPSRILVAPDCGLRTRTWEVAFEKLRNMVEGRNMALAKIGLA